MSDIVKRLHTYSEILKSDDHPTSSEIMAESAAEIDRLRTELAAEREKHETALGDYLTTKTRWNNERKRASQLEAERDRAEERFQEKSNAVVSLYAQLAEAREALEPFVEAAANFDTMPVKDPEGWFAYSGQSSCNKVVGAITVGDLRRARTVYEKIKGGRDE